MKSPEEFWSKRQHTDSSAMENWVLARQRVGKSFERMFLIENFLKTTFKGNNIAGVIRDHVLLKRPQPPFYPTICERLSRTPLGIVDLHMTLKRPQPLLGEKATITSKLHITA